MASEDLELCNAHEVVSRLCWVSYSEENSFTFHNPRTVRQEYPEPRHTSRVSGSLTAQLQPVEFWAAQVCDPPCWLHTQLQPVEFEAAQVPDPEFLPCPLSSYVQQNLRSPSSELWKIGGVSLWGFCRTAQVEECRDLRIPVQVRNDFHGTSMNLATLLEGKQGDCD